MNITFIGLGIMGSRMAANLLKAGHQLTVFNRSKDKAEALLNQGAKWGESTAESVREAEVVITMLSKPEVVEEMAQGSEGWLHNMQEDAIWMDSSTVNPSFTHRMQEYAHDYGIAYIEAPVAGSKPAAEQAELVFLVGGEQAHVDRCRPLMKVMGKDMKHMGEVGKGASIKLLINMMLGLNYAVFTETLLLGESMGLEQGLIFDVLTNIHVTPGVIGKLRGKIEQDDRVPNFPLQWLRKDLHLAAQSAYENGESLAILQAVKERYALAEKAGHGDEDFTALYAFLKGINS
ncbi:MAG: NAD(P)-dependent oxidoreductase [Bacteroidota bacterium]